MSSGDADVGLEVMPDSRSQPLCVAGRSTVLWILIAFVLVGIGLRLRQYQARTSFFADEASLILNFRSHTAGELLRHLDYRQAAPPVFLWIGRAIYLRFGPNEYALRLFPLLGGLASLTLFAALAWRTLPPWQAVIAVAFFALCENLITFCAELKQYSTDALLSVVLLYAFLVFKPDWRPAPRVLVLSIITAVGLWISHPSILVFAALTPLLLWESFRRGRWEILLALAACIPVLVSFATLYLVSIRHLHDPFLFVFWAGGFPDWSRPLTFPVWLWRQTVELFHTPYPGLTFLLFALGLIGVGFASMRREAELLVACVAPVALTILAACLYQYPYNGSRLTVFLFPGLFLISARGAGALREMLPQPWGQFWWVAAIPILVLGIVQGGYRALFPRYLSHIRPVVAYVREHLQPGEAIYTLGETGLPNGPLQIPAFHNEFLAYWPDPPAVVHTQLESVDTIHEKRFWVTLAFRPHIKRTLQVFDRLQEVAEPVGKPLILPQGGAACLFELRKQ